MLLSTIIFDEYDKPFLIPSGNEENSFPVKASNFLVSHWLKANKKISEKDDNLKLIEFLDEVNEFLRPYIHPKYSSVIDWRINKDIEMIKIHIGYTKNFRKLQSFITENMDTLLNIEEFKGIFDKEHGIHDVLEKFFMLLGFKTEIHKPSKDENEKAKYLLERSSDLIINHFGGFIREKDKYIDGIIRKAMFGKNLNKIEYEIYNNITTTLAIEKLHEMPYDFYEFILLNSNDTANIETKF